MKKYIFIIAAVLSVITNACNEAPIENGDDPYLNIETRKGINPTLMTVPTDGFSETFTVKSNTAWRIEKSPAEKWLVIDLVSGTNDGSVTFSAGKNESNAVLSTTVEFFANGKSVFSMTLTQQPAGVYLSADPMSASVPFDGGDIVITIMSSSADWEYHVTGNNPKWLTEKSKGADNLVLSASANALSADRDATLVFSTPSDPDLKVNVPIIQKSSIADLLDVVFDSNGTATDVSPMKNTVQTIAGDGMTTYYNDQFGRYVGWFNHSPGSNNTDGYFKVDFENNETFRKALADGHTLETVFMFNDDLPINVEIKPFSAMQSGGTGFLITNNARNNQITFLPNTTGGWKWTQSGITPAKGMYYHVVGVWDKVAGKSYVYVNGELKATADAAGTFNFATAGSNWFAIGGDSDANSLGNAWKGDIVTAKIYDDPLSKTSVNALWNLFKDKVGVSQLSVSGAMFLTGLEVAAGSSYTIFGSEFKSGDKVRLESMDGRLTFNCDAVFSASGGTGVLKLKIPAEFETGKYKLILVRGIASAPIGIANFTVTDNPATLKLPRIIAHRGLHTTGITENTVASFKAANELGGVYGSEADFWITTDGVIVSNHDGKVNGLTVQNSNYYGTAMEGKTDLFSDYVDYMKANPSAMKLIIEIKSHSTSAKNNACADEIIKQVAAAGLNDKVEYIAFNYDLCVYLAGKVPSGTVVGYLNGDKTPSSIASGIKCIDYNANILRKNTDWIQQAHDKDMVVNVWTIYDSRADMMEFINKGVDYITTDYPQTMKALHTLLE